MKFFIAGIMQGSYTDISIHDQGYRASIGEVIKARFTEAEIVDPMESHPDGTHYGPEKTKQTLLEMAEEAAQADVLIAYLPEASMGTAVEMWEAHRAGKPVFTISPLAENWVVRSLSARVLPSLAAFESFVAEGELEKLFEL